MIINKENLQDKYLRAITAFKSCIADKENEFLKKEIGVPINLIITREEFIKIQFLKMEINNFNIEVKIQLFKPNGDLFGSYTYYENEEGIPIDDKLVFD